MEVTANKDQIALLAARLNRDADAAVFDRDALEIELNKTSPEFARRILQDYPYLYAGVPVFLTRDQVQTMQAVVSAVTRVVALPGWREGVPRVPDYMPRADSVFFGYDFHVNGDGVHLIEINTNAGGAFFNALLTRSQRNAGLPGVPAGPEDAEPIYLDMFRNEWRLQRGEAPLRSVAIMDEKPQEQFMHPEFLLAQAMFRCAGLHAVIVDPSDLQARADGLYHDGVKIDLIYNRLTDFALERFPELDAAYKADRVVLTPHPCAYSLYADKRNLERLSDAAMLQALGALPEDIDLLQRCVPQTLPINPADAEQWRADRRRWFFKPATGFGSRGTYRGENTTRRVFEEIMQGNYVAQRLAPPDERVVRVGGDEVVFKSDVRCYVYQARVQMVSAALYQGQTHNTRTPGGGFSLARIVG